MRHSISGPLPYQPKGGLAIPDTTGSVNPGERTVRGPRLLRREADKAVKILSLLSQLEDNLEDDCGDKQMVDELMRGAVVSLLNTVNDKVNATMKEARKMVRRLKGRLVTEA
jgi:hypothetical protein